MILVFLFSFTLILLGTRSQPASKWIPPLPCNKSANVTFIVVPGNNKYNLILNINEELSKGSTINISLQGALSEHKDLDILQVSNHETVSTQMKNTQSSHSFYLKSSQEIPDIKSLKINNEERCVNLNLLYIGDPLQSLKNRFESDTEGCGTRKIQQTQVFTGGATTRPGDWPWHTLIMQRTEAVIKYICGGTLISRSLVLTAAHCVTYNGVGMDPDSLTVSLGKYKLDRGDAVNIDKKVLEVIIHPDYDQYENHNDIALLKLKTPATYDVNIQPACLWESEDSAKLFNSTINGTVVGWGIRQKNSLSNELYKAILPKIPAANCIKNKGFFLRSLKDGKFCAGLKTGIMACNGDSGGGYFVFVPDTPGDTSEEATGRWYIHGISSDAVAIEDESNCDPRDYLLFTDVETYSPWIKQYLN